MRITNKHNLPACYHRAVQNDPYDKGDSDFSATGLMQTPRAFALLEKHGDEAVVDCSQKVAATIGKGAHSII